MNTQETIDYVNSLKASASKDTDKRAVKYVKAMEEQILNTPELLESIRQKAEANGISFEEQLHADAAWIINYQIEQGEITIP